MNLNRTAALALALAVVVAAALSGCSAPKPTSADDCAKIDWARAGARTAANGNTADSGWRFNRGPECVAAGWPSNKAAFDQAYVAGLPGYCAPRNGLSEGRKNNGYRGICPPGLEEEFRRAHDMGRVLHQADADRQSAESRLSKARGVANDDKKSPKEREDARRDVATHQTARDNANARITSLEATAAQLGWGLGR
jgi:hypothetical protein